MKNQIITYFKNLLALLCIMLVSNCDDFIDVDSPNSQLTTDTVFEDETTATAAIIDIYAQMRENGIITGRIDGLSSLLGTYADELVSFENGIYTTESFYNNSLLPSSNYVSNIWNASYSQIYAANAILEGIDDSDTLTENVKSQLQGEALFIRAFLHFHLVNTYGDIPYVATTDYNENSNVIRMPIETVYQAIISDLEVSIGLLNTSYSNSERTRPNKSTAQAFLARVYLYHGDFEEAETMTTSVINNTENYALEENIDDVFLANSMSTIWQLSPGASGANTYEAITFIFYEGPPNQVSLNDNLISQFEDNDLRKTHWVAEVSDGDESWYHSFKYKLDYSTGSSSENSIVMRLAEQYLIRSEARAMLGDITGSKEDLNQVRNRAGLPNTDVNSQNELIETILQERNLELFTEFGHRFFDLKRLGRLDDTLSLKSGWNTNDHLWPLPLTELIANPNLSPQNPGY